MDPTITAKRKPRQARGTPSYYYRNRFATAVIAVGLLSFGLFALTPVFGKVNQVALKVLDTPADEQERHKLLEIVKLPRSPAAIKASIEEHENLMSER